MRTPLSLRYRSWVLAVLAGLTILIGLDFLVWKFYTEDFLVASPRGGDLTRVGYIDGSSYPEKKPYALRQKHFENHDYRPGMRVDLLTIGDSFSNGCAKDDQYYQDYIATHQNLKVMNIQPWPGKSYIETIAILLNSGYLDRVQPRFILIQRVERHVIEDLAGSVNFDETRTLEEVDKFYGLAPPKPTAPKVGFLNIGNLKFLLYKILYQVKDNAFFSKVYLRVLDRPFFHVKNSRNLIFCYEDIAHIQHADDSAVRRLNDNFNKLAWRLKKKGITLIFMPVVDKYNLYSRYIMNNPYPSSVLFEKLDTLKKNYYFLNTKKYLSQAVDRGERDVYYADDTHWSIKGPEAIFGNVLLDKIVVSDTL